MTTEWWRDFFHGLAAAFWHRFVPPALTAAEAEFLGRQFPPRARLLDVPCGDGRHACALARAGCSLVAVDQSSTFLDWARAAGAGLDVAFEQRDMRDLPWPRRFDGAFCFGNSFGYLGDDGDAAFLAAVQRALRPGGTFVLDAATFEAVFPSFQRTRRHAAGSLVMESEVHWDPERGELRTDYVFRAGDQEERRSAFLRVRPAREVAELLHDAGFGDVRILGGLDGRPLVLGESQRALFVAQV
jgi:SAM-dependent methyltransferase